MTAYLLPSSHRSAVAAALAAAGLALNACAVHAQPAAGPAAPVPGVAFPISGPAAEPASAFPVPGSGPLDTLTLAAAERQLLGGSRDLQTARAALEAARGASITAGKRPNPVLTVGVGAAQHGLYQFRQLDKNIRIDQLVERGNKRGLRAEAAEQAVQAAALDIRDTLRQLRLALAQAYFDLKLNQDRIGIARANAEAFARSIEVAQKRLSAGDIAPADLVRLRVDAGRSENELRQAQSDLEAARVTVAVLIARERDAALIQAADPWPVPDAALAQPEQLERLVDQRADVIAAAARVRSADAGLRLAIAQRTRDVSVGLFADQNLPSNNGFTVGVQVGVPLFINNNFAGDILRAEADLRTAQVNLDRTRANALAEVDRAFVAYRSAVDRLDRFERRIVPDAQRSVQATEFAYQRGALGVTDLLDARRQFYGAQRELLDARADFAKAQAALRASLASAEAPEPTL